MLGSTRSRFLLPTAAALAMLLLPVASHTLPAQGTTLTENWVGSETEEYLRALALRRPQRAASWMMRPFAPAEIDRWAADSSDHPWRAHMQELRTTGPITVLRPSASASYNSALPWGFNDGAVWQGKGANLWITAGAAFRFGLLSGRFEPLAFVAQNAAFELIPAVVPGRNPYLDSQRSGAIDLPQRFGDGRYGRLDLGQSFLRIDSHGLAATFGTENIGWGPSLRQPLLLGANAGGFPHVTLGTGGPVSSPLGTFLGELLYGQLSQSDYAPDTRGNGKRLLTGLIVAWSPPGAPGLELGASRVDHSDWKAMRGFRTLLSPFSGPQEVEAAGPGVANNQIASVFARYSSTAAGLELYGEFGKNDRNGSLRDLIVEPDHDAAWSLGLLKVLRGEDAAKFFTVRGEVLNGRVTSLHRIRGQATFYEHVPISEGHTQRGQLLGTPLLDRGVGFEGSVDRWSDAGRVGIMLTQRTLPPDLAEGSLLRASRAQWAVEANGTSFRRRSDLSWRAGVLFDLNRVPGRDAHSLFVGGGWRGSVAGLSR